MGRTSPFSFARATRLAPAKCIDSERGPLPLAKMLTTDSNACRAAPCSAPQTASSKCWARRPEGHGAEDLENACRHLRISSAGIRQSNAGAEANSSSTGNPCGCLEQSAAKVAWESSVRPLLVSVRHAWLSLPSSTSSMQRLARPLRPVLVRPRLSAGLEAAAIRDTQIRSMHEMGEMKRVQELRVDEVSVQKTRENHETIQKLT